MSMTTCAKCGIGVRDGAALYRVSPKGQAPVMECRECYQGILPQDDIAKVIEDYNRRRRLRQEPHRRKQ